MKARILRALNPVGLFLILLLCFAIQSTLFYKYPFSFFQPDFLALFIAWIAMKRDFLEGGILTLIFSKIAEIHSSSPAGLLMISCMVLFLGVKFFYRNVQINDWKQIVGLGIASSLIDRVVILLVLTFLGRFDNQGQYTLRFFAPNLIVHALIALPVFRFLHRYDQWTLKDPRSFNRLENDFFLDEEWI